MQEALQWHREQAEILRARLQTGQPAEAAEREYAYQQLSPYPSHFFLVAYPGEYAQMHSQDYFELVFPLTGTCRVETEARTLMLEPGDFYLICPGLRHMVWAEGDTFAITGRPSVFFGVFLPMAPGDGSVVNRLLTQAQEEGREELLLRQPLGECGLTLVRMLIVESYRQEYLYDKLMEHVLSILLVFYTRRLYRLRPVEQKNIRGKLTDILAYMKENSDSVTLSETARRFNYNSDYLSATLRRETGRGFVDLIRDYKLERAAILLRTSGMTAAEIAGVVGYSQYSGFYKSFKQKFGVSPNVYARRKPAEAGERTRYAAD